MKDKTKKEITIEGVDCNKCLSNIKKEVNQLKGVNASIDNHQKRLVLNIDAVKDVDRIINKVKFIANKHEHHIIVQEKKIENKVVKPLHNKIVKTYHIENLDCANCAAKIERQISNLNGVIYASCDFISKKLVFEVANSKELDQIINHVKSTVKKVEPDAILIDKDEELENSQDAEKKEAGHLKDFITLGIGIIFFILGISLKLSLWQELTIFLIGYLFVGGEVVLRAIKNISRGKIFDENFLMTIATVGAFLIRDFAEGVAVMIFYQVGELFQDIAVDRSRRSISQLMDIRPDYANLKLMDGIKKVNPSEVEVGDFIIVKPGEKVPLDGKVIEGNSFVDTRALTGESVLREVETGSDVLSGFVNTSGLLTVEVTKTFGESTVSVILDLVENASSKKAATENFITKFARYYTPAVVIAAVLIAFLPLLFIEGATLSEWGPRALVFLVISCPCALVISIPLGFFGGIGGASIRGILVKGSNYLEALNDVETVVFDKTGTLTKGVFNVTEVNPQNGYTNEDLIKYAAYAESYSNHPIAQSILKYYNTEIDKEQITSYEEVSGKGIKVELNRDIILAGNVKLMTNYNINFIRSESHGTVVYVSKNGEFVGNIIIADEIKEDSKKAISDLKDLGIRSTIMLTGDSEKVGAAVGLSLGIDQVFSELLPNEKVDKFELLEEEKSPKGKIIFVGDGINDAPVLARADVGIAMGGLGSDAAIEAADIVIMTDEPSKIATVIKIARRTRKIVWENIIFSLVVKGLFLILGAIGIASLWGAVFADVGVSVIAIMNAMRVMKTKKI
ncbi:MAG: heavy metal translocating P-type ATPase [Bacilli bacterium]|nr:heavy metal translocating P-type ATPase [Bacilli bacterium]